MSRLIQLYKKFLHQHPFYFQVVQTGVLMGTGDVIAQTLVERKSWKQYSFRRTMQFTTVGLFLVGPVLTKWYGFLEKSFGHSKYAVFKKVALDQSVMAPSLIASILTSLGLLGGHSITEVKEDLQRDYFDILCNNYKFWPAVQLFNFYVVPLFYQVLVAQIAGMMWNTYVSWRTQRQLKMEEE